MATTEELEIASYEESLKQRSEGSCELCASADALSVYAVPPVAKLTMEKCALVCSTCLSQLTGESDLDEKHWLCLNESAWSQVPAVQAIALRMLKRISANWAGDLAEQLYIEDEVRSWADSEVATQSIYKDSNGAILKAGDTVSVIKDIDVAGTSFVAKRGTVVKGIRLAPDTEHIEGRVNGTVIYIKTSLVKKI